MPSTVVVTGGNRGIGFATAKILLARGEHVVIVARDTDDGERARIALSQGARGEVRFVRGALDSVARIRATAAALLAGCPRIDVLVHNAGVWPAQRERDEAGLERAFVVNHLAPFLLNRLLEPRLIASRARVVQVSAGLYVKGRPDLARTPTGDDFSAFGTYATTKLCNLLLVPWFARRWAGRGVTIDAVHPGVIRTGLGDRAGPLGLLLRAVKLAWKHPDAGARPVVRLALDPALREGTGRYFEIDREVRPEPCARDAALAEALAHQAEQLCGLAATSAIVDERG